MRDAKRVNPVTLEPTKPTIISRVPSVKVANKQVITHIITFIVGFCIGLFLFGWYLWPVEWIIPQDITYLTNEQKLVIYDMFSENLSLTNDTEKIRSNIGVIDGHASYNICQALASPVVPLDKKARLLYLQYILLGENKC